MRFPGMLVFSFGILLGLVIASRSVHAEDPESQKAYEEAMAAGKAAAEKEDWDKALAAYQKALRAKDGDAAAGAAVEKAEQSLGKTVLVLDEVKNIRMEFVWIKPGTFMIGSDDESGEGPVHQVTITRGFWMGKTEVTQEQWEAVVGDKPSLFKGDHLPVEQVSWDDIHQKFLPTLKANGKEASLPTEAEWEYACRAASKTRYCFGDDRDSLGDYAWFQDNADNKTHEVGKKKANGWGLHDMHGNVWEWCEDRDGRYEAGAVTDPVGAATGSKRVVRGGGWNISAYLCRSAERTSYAPAFRFGLIGFRIVLR